MGIGGCEIGGGRRCWVPAFGWEAGAADRSLFRDLECGFEGVGQRLHG